MSRSYLVENKTFVELNNELQICVERLRTGMDVSPAQCFRLEGLAAALIADGIDIETLEHACIKAGADAIAVIRNSKMLRFDCWQKRAPVYPSTTD